MTPSPARRQQPAVTRVDRYTVLVDGHRVTATADQEARIAAMTEEQRSRFRTVMGLGTC